MTLKERVNTDYLKAFKEKNTMVKNLLSVVKGEIQTVEKNTGSTSLSDEEVIKILNKTAKSLKENINAGVEQAKIELEVVESYLPKQMSREEIITKVKELVGFGVTNIGAIMKEFATLPADKKVVSEVVKEVIK